MTLAKKRADFCRRMQTLSRVRHVQASRQKAFYPRQAEQERSVVDLPGVCEQEVSGVPKEEAGQPVEFTPLSVRSVQGGETAD
jgi:hypothetical protein